MIINSQTSSRHADEAEKPFWISYSDLMTALMILFLVVMVTSLSSISQQAIEIKSGDYNRSQPIALAPPTEAATEVKPTPTLEEKPELDEEKMLKLKRLAAIQNLCAELGDSAAANNLSARVNCNLNRIDFGESGRFEKAQYKLNAQGAQILKDMVPIILKAARSTDGQQWLRRIHIQGFTDTDGSYLYNLNLSLKRSEWVMCQILATNISPPLNISADDRKLVKQLFMAGGVSFNNAKSSKEESRRIELKLEFHEMNSAGEPQKDDSDPVFMDETPEKCHI